MLQTKMAPSSAVLRPYVWAYGMTTGKVGSVPLVISLPARPKQLLTFSFEDTYRIRRPDSDHSDASPRVAVVGPQTHAGAGLSACGSIDNFTIHFQPSGFNRLFGIPMTELTDAAYDAYAVIGPQIPSFEHQIQRRLGSQAPIALPGVDADRQRSRLLRSDAFGPRLSCLHGRVPLAVPGAPRGRARVPYLLRD